MFSRKEKLTRSVTDNVGIGPPQSEPPRPSTKGAYGLKKCHDVTDAVADIVFVHGLTGNRETTWTDKSTGVFWPAHLLKSDVPKTRIVTFGYDADLAHFWSVASQNCVRNHAINLANAIAQLRERTETEDRPIIFVAHSLGGLVFEDAMLASRNSPEPHLQRVYESTVGVCFLGTPHCGTTLANWATVFGQISSTVKKINTDLLKVLEPESEVLARIQGDFHAMLRSRADQGRPNLSITCFFEELPVKGVGEIVPKHSAILPAYNSIGIYANHMDMARFSDGEDPGYLSVSTELMRWVRAILKANAASAAGPQVSAIESLPSSLAALTLAAHASPSTQSEATSETSWSKVAPPSKSPPSLQVADPTRAPYPPSGVHRDSSPFPSSTSTSAWAPDPHGMALRDRSPCTITPPTDVDDPSHWWPEPPPIDANDPSYWALGTAPVPGATRVAPQTTLYPPSAHGYYQPPPGFMQYAHPYPQRIPSPVYPQHAPPPQEWRRSPQPPAAPPGPNNVISGPIYGNGKILQGTFGNVSL
ncbi:hypothetical protein OQA88_5376 [Cercophora sp. LCS_1]